MTTEMADSSEPELQPASHMCTDFLHSDRIPRSPCKARFIVSALERAVGRQHSAVSPLRNCLTQSHTSMPDGGKGIKVKPFWQKQENSDDQIGSRAPVSQCGFPSAIPASALSLPQELIQSLLPNKHATCQLCLRDRIPGQAASHKHMACVLTISLDSSYFPTLTLHKTCASLHIRQPDSGIFWDKRQTKGVMGKAETEAK